MKRVPLLWLTLSLVLCALVALPAHRAMADDESDELEFRVEGTLEAVDCTAQTINVLGLTIGIGGARLDTAGDVCTDFVVGEQVEARLASDIAGATSGNLKAGRVKSNGNSGAPPRLKGPIQAISADKSDMRILGKKVDISQGRLEGMDDSMHPNHNVPADPSQMIVGQFVQVRLVGSTPPFVAEEVEIENFKNEIEVELENEHGVEIHDLVKIEVHNHTLITPAAASPLDGATVRRSKTRDFKHKSHGKFTLRGLFTGEAKIIIEREVHGHHNRVGRVVKVRGDRTGHLKVRLRDN
jgi:hypothetical protein